MGIGYVIQYHYFAPLDETSDTTANREINYMLNSHSEEDEYSLLLDFKYNEYAHKQCMKICHYI